MKNIIIFDNGGETFDRFTIINRKDGEMIGSSDNPFHPQGFGQHCGNVAWTYFTNTIGAGYMRRMENEQPKYFKRIMRQKTAEIVKEFIKEGNIGKIVEFSTLPDPVKQFVHQSFA